MNFTRRTILGAAVAACVTSVATVAGAVGGAVVGNQVEGNMRATRSYTIKVRMEDGSLRTFHRSAPNWQQGERVRVVKGQLRRG
eukprot:gene32848-40546_t